jgi:hypothetical protein
MTRAFTILDPNGPVDPLGNPLIQLDLNNYQANGIAVNTKDLGAPTVREVVYNKASSDGVDDVTQFLGQRLITIAGNCYNMPGQSRSKAFVLLMPFMDPQKRYTLQYKMDDDVRLHEMRNLRISMWQRASNGPTAFSFQLQYKADPAAFDCQQQSVTMTSLFTPAAGRVYNRTYDLVYPTAVAIAGSGVANSIGTYKTWPIVQFYGPCVNPQIQMRLQPNASVIGQIRVLITLQPGDMLEVDTLNRTVMLGGAAGTTRYADLDFINTYWQPMQPGPNYFRFSADSASPPASAAVLWNDAYI